MDLYLDTANLEEIKKVLPWGILRGVTTNPSLIARERDGTGREEAVSRFHHLIRQICRIVPGPVSAEVLAEEEEAMVQEARILAGLAPNVVVKVPVTAQGLIVMRRLREEGISTNATLVFSVNQALLAARAGASYASPFLGRIDDTGGDGVELVKKILQVYRSYDLATCVIAASIRHPRHITAVALEGAHIATLPYSILVQMVQHPLTKAGLERFRQDWRG